MNMIYLVSELFCSEEKFGDPHYEKEPIEDEYRAWLEKQSSESSEADDI